MCIVTVQAKSVTIGAWQIISSFQSSSLLCVKEVEIVYEQGRIVIWDVPGNKRVVCIEKKIFWDGYEMFQFKVF